MDSEEWRKIMRLEAAVWKASRQAMERGSHDEGLDLAYSAGRLRGLRCMSVHCPAAAMKQIAWVAEPLWTDERVTQFLSEQEGE